MDHSNRLGQSAEDVALDRMFPKEPSATGPTAEELRSEVADLRERNFQLWQRLRETRGANQCSISDCIRKPHIEARQTGLCEVHLRDSCADYVQMMNPTWGKQDRGELDQLDELVYYIQMAGRVKIGRTKKLRQRMDTFYAQPEQLLAVEPCVVHNGINRKTQRHREFASCRLSGTELFEVTDELTAHIVEVVATFGDPSRYL